MPNRVTPYEKTVWVDRPSTSSPINETNLNHLEQGVKNVTDALNDLVVDIQPATRSTLGGIKVGNNLTVENDGTLSADAQQYTLPTASDSTLGGIKVGNNLSIDQNGVLSAVDETYTPEPATSTKLGCVKIGDNLSITQDGTLSAENSSNVSTYINSKNLIKFNSNILNNRGGTITYTNHGSKTVKINQDCSFVITGSYSGGTLIDNVYDIGTIENNTSSQISVYAPENIESISLVVHGNGVSTTEVTDTTPARIPANGSATVGIAVMSTVSNVSFYPMLSLEAPDSYEPPYLSNLDLSSKEYLTEIPVASASKLGGIKVGNNLSITSNGVLSADAQQYTLPTASDSTLGGIKVGNNLSIDQNGVLSSSVPEMSYEDTLAFLNSTLEIVSFQDGTDAQIAAMLAAHYNDVIDIHDYWNIGDHREIQLSASSDSKQSAQNVYMVLTNMDVDNLNTPIGNHTTAAFEVHFMPFLSSPMKMNETYDESLSSFTETTLYTWLNSAFINMLPSDISGMFKEFNHLGVNNTRFTIPKRSDFNNNLYLGNLTTSKLYTDTNNFDYEMLRSLHGDDILLRDADSIEMAEIKTISLYYDPMPEDEGTYVEVEKEDGDGSINSDHYIMPYGCI